MKKLVIGDKFKDCESEYEFVGYLFKPKDSFNAYAVADADGNIQDYLSGLNKECNHNPRINWCGKNHKLERMKVEKHRYAIKVLNVGSPHEWVIENGWYTLAEISVRYPSAHELKILETKVM